MFWSTASQFMCVCEHESVLCEWTCMGKHVCVGLRMNMYACMSLPPQQWNCRSMQLGPGPNPLPMWCWGSKAPIVNFIYFFLNLPIFLLRLWVCFSHIRTNVYFLWKGFYYIYLFPCMWDIHRANSSNILILHLHLFSGWGISTQVWTSCWPKSY